MTWPILQPLSVFDFDHKGWTHPMGREVRLIRWHDLAHQFVSLLITAGKHPKYIAAQAGHSDGGLSMKRYGHLFDTVKITLAD